ncbi:MAG: hypothetical protein KDA97_13220, partial [Acidimicrobiales bacterium]|nr:hypothetical protein [Acidimicrobiales bacterium]
MTPTPTHPTAPGPASRRWRRRVAVLALAGTTLASCSVGGSDAADTSTDPAAATAADTDAGTDIDADATDS